jgi:hypothetical protein
MRAKTVVAARAASTSRRIAEVAQDKGSAACAGVRVLLHHVELGEISLSPAVEQRPIDRIRAERLRAVSQPPPTAEPTPLDILVGL